MSEIPDLIELVRFVCSACGKRSTVLVKAEKMKCPKCQEIYERRKGEWMPERYWKGKGKKNGFCTLHRGR